MRINRLTIQNFLGIRFLDVETERPISIFVGPNGSGKSSIAEAVRFALLGEFDREKLKKNVASMVAEGHKDGRIKLGISNGDEWAGDISVGVIDGPNKNTMLETSFLPFVLAPHRFASLEPNARRSLLFELTGCGASQEEVKKRLIDRGCDKDKVEQVLPLLRSGFEAACDHARDMTKESRGAWRAITGEVYGPKKADGWKAEAPDVDIKHMKEVEVETDQIEQKILANMEEAGKLRGAVHMIGTLREERQRLGEVADKLERFEKTVALRRKGLEDAREDIVQLREMAEGNRAPEKYECPECHSNLMWHEGCLHPYRQDGKEPDSEAVSALSEQEAGLKKLESSLENYVKQANEAKKASERIDVITETLNGSPNYIDELAMCEDTNATLKQDKDELTKTFEQMRGGLIQAQQAEQKTADAAGYHAEVVAWSVIADALAPSGIQSEILSGALRPANDRLHASAAATGWMVPTINNEMDILGDGRPYRLLSESERWRVDAMIAETISHLSGMNMLALDRFDVLDLPGRTQLIVWLVSLARKQQMETAFVFGTLKALPEFLPEEASSYWMEDGGINQQQD